MSDPKSKLIVDEDWKTQAQAEKEALEAQAHQPPAGDVSSPPAADKSHPEHGLPPADFSSLVTMLATQALVTLGQIPNPITGKPEIDLEYAKHYIDLIDMLEKKTQGNRSDEENRLLDSILHELRMIFVHMSKQPSAPPASAETKPSG